MKFSIVVEMKMDETSSRVARTYAFKHGYTFVASQDHDSSFLVTLTARDIKATEVQELLDTCKEFHLHEPQ